MTVTSVQALIRHARLDRELASELDPMVRDRYLEIWSATRRDGADDDDDI